MLIAGAPGCRKCPVDPAYVMPKSLLIYMGLAALWANCLPVDLLLATIVISSSSMSANMAYWLLWVEFDR